MTYDFSKFPGCVSPRQESVEGDVPLSMLKYTNFSRKETDDKHLHAEFLEQAIKKINSDNIEEHNYFYATFIVYYKYDKEVYKQFATAVICENELGTSKNKCRNRNYYFFSHLDPITLANVIVDDISRSTPIVRRCVWDKSP